MVTQAVDVHGNAIPRCFKFGTTHTVAVAVASGQSPAIGSSMVRIVASVGARILVGADPTAVNDDPCEMIRAFDPTFMQVNVGDKIAVIRTGGADGWMFITELE